MVVHVLPKNNTPPVVWVEVHIECIYFAIATIVDDDRKALGPDCIPGTVRLDSVEPGWMRGNIVIGCEVDAFPAFIVQGIEIIKVQRGWIAIHDGKINFRFGVVELGSDVTREVCFARVQPDDRS